MRLLVDRSAVANQRFRKFDAIVKAWPINKGKPIFLLSSMLLEESLVYWFKTRSQESIDQIDFLSGLSNERYLNSPEEIHFIELMKHSYRDSYWQMDPACEANIKNNLRSIVDRGMFDKRIARQAQEETQDRYKRTERLRSVAIQIRNEVARNLKERGGSFPRQHDDQEWERFLKAHLDTFGRGLIIRRGWYGSQKDTIRRWDKKRWLCPYFEAWVQVVLYIQYYSMREQNKPIDLNAYSDALYLMYLERADGILSEETAFMKTAFDRLYTLKGLKYLSLADLASLS